MTAFSMSRPMPYFFVHPWALSENSIERAVERAIDIADALYTTGKIDDARYNEYMTAFHEWSENAYKVISK